MSLIVDLTIILVCMTLVVAYQSRHEPLSVSLYLRRLMKLTIIVLTLIKNIAIFTLQQIRQTDWDLL